jgi:arylsulfotransferase ASST
MARLHRILRCTALAALLAICAPAGRGWAGPSGTPRLTYVSPTPGARNLRPQTNIILHFDRPLDGPGAVLPGLRATGSLTGIHPGRMFLTCQDRTVVFEPARAFAPGESVAVTIVPTAPLEHGVLGLRLQFGFSVSARLAPEAIDWQAALGDPWPPAGVVPGAPGRADSLPPGFPAITSTIYGTPASGRLFMCNFGHTASPPFLMILDDAGTPIFDRQMPGSCFDFKVQPDGRLTYFDSITGKFYAMDAGYTVVDSFACGNGYDTDVHELRLLPNGNALLLGLDDQTVDMSAIVPGGSPAATVIGFVIQELDPQKHVVFQWRTWDHFQITDAPPEDLTAARIDYVHANALELDTDGNVLLSSRHMDEITKINHETGDIVWRWGGKNNQFTLVGDTLPFSHQHAIRRIANGHVTLFDNGNFHTPQFSRAVEYALDETNHTATRVWEFRHTPDVYGPATGYVQRLDNGATLIGWGTGKPDVTEVAPDGTVVMELSLPNGQWSYRVYRHAWNTEQAGSPGALPPAVVLSPNTPNPFRNRTDMRVSLRRPGDVAFQVFDVKGRRLGNVVEAQQQQAGVYRVRIDLSRFDAGVYLFRVTTADGTRSRKILHLN